jgi:hypothetical protein
MELQMTVVQRTKNLWRASNDHSSVHIERHSQRRGPDVYDVNGQRFSTLNEAVTFASHLLRATAKEAR